MQFLLTAINAKFIHSNPAIYSLRAYAGEKLQPHIALAEYTINNRMDEILSDLYSRRPNAIGFSCYIWNWNLIQELIVELPKVLPETDIWLGGPEVSVETSGILEKFPMVKGIMVGEGEETFKDIMAYYVGNGRPEIGSKYHNFRDIPGLAMKGKETRRRNLTDLNDLPFFYDRLLVHDSSGSHIDGQSLGNRILYYETSRGCPYKCAYCLSSIDRQMRYRDIKTVKRELKFFLSQKIPQIKLLDRTFNCRRERALEIWRYLVENDNGVTNFHFEVAGELIGEEELALFKSMRPGLIQLEIGVQTTNWDTLKAISRNTDIAHIGKAVGIIREYNNIHIHLDLIAGLPFEGYESFKKSFNDVYAMRPHQLQLGFLKVLKGTAIWERAREYGIVCHDKPPYEVLYTKWISYDQIQKLKQIEEMLELYYNSNQFMYTLPVLQQAFASPFELFEKLAGYYREKGYFTSSPARSYRYQVLLDFAICHTGLRKDLIKELLTFDYYLRENAKSRPAFCGDLSRHWDEMCIFYQMEEKNPQYLENYSGYRARQVMKMTHMEAFYYDVWDSGKEVELRRHHSPRFVLFDYEKRSPVTGQAAGQVVEFPKSYRI
ncbi:MAG: B12-binding domain-containing radical SAM protein [Lachnospiraceae bacterium]|nr:B12-binding domain-containing radical SAM protein [Lachnospiraceae bacterium]MDE7334490.1 B12-binding domain-containing radical SAM protein [Lachnospiraceae bacterium]